MKHLLNYYLMLLLFGCFGSNNAGILSWLSGEKYYKYSEVIKQEYPFDYEGILEIDGRAGKIEIEGWDNPTISIEVTKLAAYHDGLGKIDVKIDVTNHRCHIRSILKEEGWIIKGGKGAIDYKIMVPRDVRLAYISSAAGSIHIAGVYGDIRAFTAGGALNIQDAVGSIDVLAKLGAVKIECLPNSQGNIRIESSGGVVEIIGSQQSIDLDCGTASVTIKQKGFPSNAHMNIKTRIGSITIELPDDVGAWINAHTSAGEIISDFVLKEERSSEGVLYLSKRRAGIIGIGGGKINLRTNAGSISMMQTKD